MNPLSNFPRIRLAHLPTPIEPMSRLSEHLGGPQIWCKRDDCTGLGLGGNKIRKLEFLLGDALAKDNTVDTVLTCGALQSNHARQTAAAAAKLGMKCHIFLENRETRSTDDYQIGGNVLLDHLTNSMLHVYPHGTDVTAQMILAAEQLRSEGRRPYVVPFGGTSPIGALGYAECALEIIRQMDEMHLHFDHVVMAAGSIGTQSGLLAGFHSASRPVGITGIAILPRADLEDQVFDLANRVATVMGVRDQIPRYLANVNHEFIGPGYGEVTASVIKTIRLVAELEGLFLDPVYTGKAMAGLIELIRQGIFRADQRILFIHTGGTPGLFAYRADFLTKRVTFEST